MQLAELAATAPSLLLGMMQDAGLQGTAGGTLLEVAMTNGCMDCAEALREAHRQIEQIEQRKGDGDGEGGEGGQEALAYATNLGISQGIPQSGSGGAYDCDHDYYQGGSGASSHYSSPATTVEKYTPFA